ncbi:MAG: hypothetical protein M3N02_10025 [Pseudomonadota bacterium]|nr:hypothetical protein [Pseudomonadota bacterium]
MLCSRERPVAAVGKIAAFAGGKDHDGINAYDVGDAVETGGALSFPDARKLAIFATLQ